MLELRRIPIRPHNFPVGIVASSSSSLHHEIKFHDKSRAFKTSKPDNAKPAGGYNFNPAIKVIYAEKKEVAVANGQFSKQIRDFIDCDCINKCYFMKEHLAPPHLKNEEKGTAIESDGKFQKKGKNYGNKVGAIFSAPQQPEAVDHEDDYDGNDGFVIFCANCNDSDDVDTDSADEDELINMYRVAHGFNISALEFQQKQQLMYGRIKLTTPTSQFPISSMHSSTHPPSVTKQFSCWSTMTTNPLLA